MEHNAVIKVMSFNMKRNYLHYGKHRWEMRAALVARCIRENLPDLLGTQELTSISLSDMKRLLPEYACVGEGRDGGENGEYSAVFYLKERFIPIFADTFWLSRTPDIPSRAWFAPFRRICTTCRLLDTSTGKQLQIYNTHLDHISYFARVNGLRLILRKMAELEKLYGHVPVVFTGDFNAKPSSRTLRELEQQMLRDPRMIHLQNSYNVLAQQSPGRSYHGFGGAVEGSPIDYIFTSKDILLQAVQIQHDSFDSYYPSDHYPVVAQLELLAGSSSETP